MFLLSLNQHPDTDFFNFGYIYLIVSFVLRVYQRQCDWLNPCIRKGCNFLHWQYFHPFHVSISCTVVRVQLRNSIHEFFSQLMSVRLSFQYEAVLKGLLEYTWNAVAAMDLNARTYVTVPGTYSIHFSLPTTFDWHIPSEIGFCHFTNNFKIQLKKIYFTLDDLRQLWSEDI